MPVILRCDKCGKETVNNFPTNQGWMVKPIMGGVEVACPECQGKEIVDDLHMDQDMREGVKKLGKLLKKINSEEDYMADD